MLIDQSTFLVKNCQFVVFPPAPKKGMVKLSRKGHFQRAATCKEGTYTRVETCKEGTFKPASFL